LPPFRIRVRAFSWSRFSCFSSFSASCWSCPDANDLLSYKFLDPATWKRIQEALLPATNRVLSGEDRDERLIRAVTDLQQRLG
jgi:hypothetical protein